MRKHYMVGHSINFFHEVNFEKKVILEEILNTSDETDIGFFLEVDSNYPDETKEN